MHTLQRHVLLKTLYSGLGPNTKPVSIPILIISSLFCTANMNNFQMATQIETTTPNIPPWWVPFSSSVSQVMLLTHFLGCGEALSNTHFAGETLGKHPTMDSKREPWTLPPVFSFSEKMCNLRFKKYRVHYAGSFPIRILQMTIRQKIFIWTKV